MSRIGNAPITIPEGVEISHSNGVVTVKGKKGELSQEMDDVVIASHINLYVNKYSLSFGEEGKKAIKALLSYSDEQSSNIFL